MLSSLNNIGGVGSYSIIPTAPLSPIVLSKLWLFHGRSPDKIIGTSPVGRKDKVMTQTTYTTFFFFSLQWAPVKAPFSSFCKGNCDFYPPSIIERLSRDLRAFVQMRTALSTAHFNRIKQLEVPQDT